MENDIFENLFVFELANNHWGNVERGKKMIADFSKVAHSNKIKAAIKLQFRDVESYIHKDFRNRSDIKCINKALKTRMSEENYGILVEAVRKADCITMSTPFDEKSVDTCVKFGVQIIKIASSNLNDKVLIEKIATTKKPVIVSTGGSLVEDTDNIVRFFENKNIPLAINHCVSVYPSEKYELELNRIDYLKNRYPSHTIGFSTHEYNEDIESAMLIAYAKGARTFERHIDIERDGNPPAPYCSKPEDMDKWIKAYFKAVQICGGEHKKAPTPKELEYLNALVRGVYAKRDCKEGEVLSKEDLYFAIPLQEGQISCKEFTCGKILLKDVEKDKPVKTDDIDLSCSPKLSNGIS